MIKETVDAVRLAELEGDKVISTAKVNGQDIRGKTMFMVFMEFAIALA